VILTDIGRIGAVSIIYLTNCDRGPLFKFGGPSYGLWPYLQVAGVGLR